jgi:hypothetical protein
MTENPCLLFQLRLCNLVSLLKRKLSLPPKSKPWVMLFAIANVGALQATTVMIIKLHFFF